MTFTIQLYGQHGKVPVLGHGIRLHVIQTFGLWTSKFKTEILVNYVELKLMVLN